MKCNCLKNHLNHPIKVKFLYTSFIKSLNMKIRNYIILLILLFSINTNAQTILTFKECVSIALENNLMIKNQKLTESIALNNIKSSEYRRLPTANGFLNGTSNWGRGIDPYTNTYANQHFNTYNGGVNANWTLFNGFYNINDIKLKKQDAESNKSILQKIKNDISIDLATRYTNILYYKELTKTIEKQLEISTQNIELTQLKIKAGSIAKNEIYKLIAQKDQELSNLIQAKNQLELNWIDLKQIMNFPIDTTIDIRDVSTIVDEKTIQSLDRKQLHEYALQHYPTIETAHFNLKKAETSLLLAKSGLYPTISWGANIGSTYSTFNKFFDFKSQIENNLSYSTSLNANIPIFNQFQTKMKVKESRLNIQKAQINIDIEKQKTEKLISQTYNNLIASELKTRATQSVLQSNEINYKNDKIKYDVGKINVQELNISKSNYFNSSANYLRDKYELLFNFYTIQLYNGVDFNF